MFGLWSANASVGNILGALQVSYVQYVFLVITMSLSKFVHSYVCNILVSFSP